MELKSLKTINIYITRKCGADGPTGFILFPPELLLHFDPWARTLIPLPPTPHTFRQQVEGGAWGLLHALSELREVWLRKGPAHDAVGLEGRNSARLADRGSRR